MSERFELTVKGDERFRKNDTITFEDEVLRVGDIHDLHLQLVKGRYMRMPCKILSLVRSPKNSMTVEVVKIEPETNGRIPDKKKSKKRKG